MTAARTDRAGGMHVDLRASIFVPGIKLIHQFTQVISLVFIWFIDEKPPFFTHANREYDGVSPPPEAPPSTMPTLHRLTAASI